jgi:8-oxo-dGTP pyrophosphatase MutT (NUDIX family)
VLTALCKNSVGVRFIIDRWVWELPGVDDGEDPAVAAAREVLEETGWRPRGLEYVLSCQPMIGNADYPQDLYQAHGADHVGRPDADETLRRKDTGWVQRSSCREDAHPFHEGDGFGFQ